MNKYWYQEQVRILQTVLREKDAAQYDAAAVVRYMKETDSNCLVVNAGGVMDFSRIKRNWAGRADSWAARIY